MPVKTALRMLGTISLEVRLPLALMLLEEGHRWVRIRAT